MTVNTSAPWKTQSHRSEASNAQNNALNRDKTSGVTALLEEEDLDHLGVLHQKPETD